MIFDHFKAIYYLFQAIMNDTMNDKRPFQLHEQSWLHSSFAKKAKDVKYH